MGYWPDILDEEAGSPVRTLSSGVGLTTGNACQWKASSNGFGGAALGVRLVLSAVEFGFVPSQADVCAGPPARHRVLALLCQNQLSTHQQGGHLLTGGNTSSPSAVPIAIYNHVWSALEYLVCASANRFWPWPDVFRLLIERSSLGFQIIGLPSSLLSPSNFENQFFSVSPARTSNKPKGIPYPKMLIVQTVWIVQWIR